MIWLASYPRSGNTFFRNVLFEVYGLKSSTYHIENLYPLDPNFDSYPFVKTHLLPEQLPKKLRNKPSVYLVRDGRDSLVSLAYYRKDFYEEHTNIKSNLLEAILAAEGSYFGGWSQNVEKWLKKADFIFRYEDFIENPLHFTEQLKEIIDLPKPKKNHIPTFSDLKFGSPEYGSGKGLQLSENDKDEIANKKFRKGITGGWKNEIDPHLNNVFWCYHGATMEKLGYTKVGNVKKIQQEYDLVEYSHKNLKRILIDGTKLLELHNDGIKRYVQELLKSIADQSDFLKKRGLSIDIFILGKIYPLEDYKNKFLIKKSIPLKRGSKAKDLAKKYKNFWIVRFMIKFYYNKTVSGSIQNFKSLFSIEQLRALVIRILNKAGLINNAAKLKPYDLIHLTLMQNYHFFEKAESKFITTIHDLTHLYFPEFHRKRNIKKASQGAEFIVSRNSHIIAISNSTKIDVLKDFKVSEEKINVVYEAADTEKFRLNIRSNLASLVLSKYSIPEQPFFLCLSTIEPRKNLLNTIEAFNLLIESNPGVNLNLVIAGKKGWKNDDLVNLSKRSTQKIIFTGFIDEPDLSIIYSEATTFVYASHYEGFGLPLLEAMSCGTPVIYGDNSSMPEVVGKAGIPVKSKNVKSIKMAMLKIISNEVLRNELKRECFKQASKFNWSKTAKQTVDLYNDVIH
ncbi:MAG: glycosyltransferase [Bacteroidota bacterium]